MGFIVEENPLSGHYGDFFRNSLLFSLFYFFFVKFLFGSMR